MVLIHTNMLYKNNNYTYTLAPIKDNRIAVKEIILNQTNMDYLCQ